MAKISDIKTRQILDSRGKPTIEVEIEVDGRQSVKASVPGGTSTGKNEAKTVDIDRAQNNILQSIKPALLGLDPREQQQIDQKMRELDHTQDKSFLGANAILGVSLGVARAGALASQMPLYAYLNKLYCQISKSTIQPVIPIPMMVMIEGGKHGNGNLQIQEFLIIGEIDKGEKVWQNLKILLGKEVPMGLEGGFAPTFPSDKDAIEIILTATKEAGFYISQDLKLGLDIAANNCNLSESQLLDFFDDYPLFSLEDPMKEDDWNGWKRLKNKLDKRNRDYLLIGDDLFTTDSSRLEQGIRENCANAIIIKPNQIGTISESLEVINKANQSGFTYIISHRSGETDDTFIADLAVATAARFFKAGAPFAPERRLKYERLKQIQEEI